VHGPLFSATLFLSAALLFFVEPMVGRMILRYWAARHRFGQRGVVFFQGALLAGYTYSHVSVAWLGVRRQAVFHLLVLALPLVCCDQCDTGGSAACSDTAHGAVAIVCVCGAPFFVVSTRAAIAALVCRDWSSRCRDPYFLYAVSNLGSFIALLAYRIGGTWLRLNEQAWL